MKGIIAEKKAPMVEVDPVELTDQRLNPEEAVIKFRAEELKKRERDKPYGQKEMDSPERSAGPRIYYTDLIAKLKKLYPALLVKDGSPGNVAIYRRKTESEIIRDGYDLSVPGWYNEHVYATGFPKDYIPEWGHYLNDTDGVALHEFRGWRSVLIAMLKANMFSYKDAVAEFGSPAQDQRSRFWYAQLVDRIAVD